MQSLFSYLVSVIFAGSVIAQPLVMSLPDSPEHYTYSNNTFTELNWHAQTVVEHRGVAGFTIDYTWDTIDPADGFFGTFYAQSPAGETIFIGFAEPSGMYSKSFNDFDQEWADGDWIFWVEDVDFFGEQRAVDITWTLDLIDGLEPFHLVADVYRDSVILTWREAVDNAALSGYRIYRDGSVIGEVGLNETSYTDDGLGLGSYCYHVVAVHAESESAPTDTVCADVFPLGTYGLPDGPTEWFRYSSYLDRGWTDLVVFDRGILGDMTIAGVWHNLNGFHDGTLHIESASGTLWETHFSGMNEGVFSFVISDFAGEEAQGEWKVWLEDGDTFGDGNYSVSDTTISFVVDYQVPTGLEAVTIDNHIELSWTPPEHSDGLSGYIIRRDDRSEPIAQVGAGQTGYIDDQLCGRASYCYSVSAVFAETESVASLGTCVGARGVIAISDSPMPNQANTYWYDSFAEAGWEEFEVPDWGVIDSLRMEFTWEANWAVSEGRFYILSPAGTQATLIHGDPAGEYSVELDDFDGEESAGIWRVWIVDNDFFFDGMFSALDITLMFDPPTQVDLNDDGELNFFDVSAFLSFFSAGDPRGDINGDGAFNFFDVSAFLAAFSAGCG